MNLKTSDVVVAKRIARTVRASRGGLPFLKALGFALSTRGLVQVSMNLVNYEITGMTAAYEAVRDQAKQLGVEIESAELVGLVPEDALDREAEYFPRLENFSEDKILEQRLKICG